MKKIILCMLLCAFATAAMAQEQEDVVVRRGKYKSAVTDTIKAPPKEKKVRTGEWYNVISFSVTAHNGDFHRSEDGWDDFLWDFQVPIELGFMRLKRTGIFFYGPGVHIKLDGNNEKYFGGDIFAHGGIELTEKNSFWGIRRIQPFVGLSLGIQYIFESSPKIYFDYDIGFSFDIGNNMAISISYYATCFDGYWERHQYETHFFSYSSSDTDFSLVLCHGAKLSFRF